MAKLLLVRHGQASYGQLDYDKLSPRGEQQARELGPYLAAQEPITLDGLAEYPGFDLVKAFLPKLVEEDPELAMMATAPTRELADRAFKTILAKWSRDEWTIDGVERVVEFTTRVEAALSKAAASCGSGGTICAVTSAGPIGVAIGLVFGATAHHMVRASSTIRNASVSELKLRTHAFAWHPDKVSLVTFNSTAHLSADLVTEY
jgi:broad specificity phosphatase PhoE